MAAYQRDTRPMSEQIQDPDVQAWLNQPCTRPECAGEPPHSIHMSDEAADRCRRIIARWRREQRAKAREATDREPG